MTDEQKMKWQSEQDQITLDYSKWSFQQRQAKLSTDHDLWKQQRDAVLARWQTNNDATRAKYLAGLAAEKAAKQSERDAQVDAGLEPTKQTLMREWLANNPNETAADFEKKAWQHLRANIIEQRNSEAFEAELQSQRATGRYSL
jgi:hypothetical protein